MRHWYPIDTIRSAAWLYFRFTTSLQDVEDLLAEHRIDVTYEIIRGWASKFGQAIAANIRRRRECADGACHLNGMVVRISCKRMFTWRVTVGL